MQFTFALWPNLLYDRNSVLILNKESFIPGLQYQSFVDLGLAKGRKIILLLG